MIGDFCAVINPHSRNKPEEHFEDIRRRIAAPLLYMGEWIQQLSVRSCLLVLTKNSSILDCCLAASDLCNALSVHCTDDDDFPRKMLHQFADKIKENVNPIGRYK